MAFLAADPLIAANIDLQRLSTACPGLDPFTVEVRGDVVLTKIVDNTSQDFSLLGGGQWPIFFGGGYQGTAVRSAADQSGDQAVWTFDGLPDGDYRISATWPAAFSS